LLSLDFVRTRRTSNLHCTENSIYVFPEMKLHRIIPNSYIHVSVIDLYIPRIGRSIWLQHNMQINPGNIKLVADRRVWKLKDRAL
jgi:hypothetical protein